MDRRAWCTAVRGVTKESDMPEQLNSSDNVADTKPRRKRPPWFGGREQGGWFAVSCRGTGNTQQEVCLSLLTSFEVSRFHP